MLDKIGEWQQYALEHPLDAEGVPPRELMHDVRLSDVLTARILLAVDT